MYLCDFAEGTRAIELELESICGAGEIKGCIATFVQNCKLKHNAKKQAWVSSVSKHLSLVYLQMEHKSLHHSIALSSTMAGKRSIALYWLYSHHIDIVAICLSAILRCAFCYKLLPYKISAIDGMANFSPPNLSLHMCTGPWPHTT